MTEQWSGYAWEAVRRFIFPPRGLGFVGLPKARWYLYSRVPLKGSFKGSVTGAIRVLEGLGIRVHGTFIVDT